MQAEACSGSHVRLAGNNSCWLVSRAEHVRLSSTICKEQEDGAAAAVARAHQPCLTDLTSSEDRAHRGKGPVAHHRSNMAWMGVTYCVLGASAVIAARSGRITWRVCPDASAASRSFPAKLTTAATPATCFCVPGTSSCVPS